MKFKLICHLIYVENRILDIYMTKLIRMSLSLFRN